jgi:aminopeptidase N
VETILDDFRNRLLANGPDGRSYDSAGPITWGYRLQNSQAPEAWHHIVYDKGAWVFHMLRRSMGDDKFIAMLKAICERYRYKGITTEQFRELAVEFLPPHSPDSSLTNFFDCWVYGTGIPTLKLEYAVRGPEISGTVTQSDVPDDFSARIPLEIQDGGQRSLYWIFTASDPVPFSIRVKSAGARVALDANDALIAVKN